MINNNAPIYLDNNATTMVAPEVVQAMLPFYSSMYGNPSSMHTFGGQVGRYIREAREQIAGALGANPDEIIFTACGSEGDNTAIHAATAAQPDKKHIITTKVEHPAVLETIRAYEKKGYEITLLDVDEKGELSLDQLEASFRPDTALVSVMWANNETGNLYPIEKISEMCQEHKVLLHTDAVQAVGKHPIDLSKTHIDYLVLSGHKLHAPKGVGALYVRRRSPYSPFMLGGHQEKGRRAGTENTASIVALGKAMTLFASDNHPHMAMLRDKLENALLIQIPDSRLNGHKTHRLCNTTNISFKNVEGEAILLLMDQAHICASSGSACASGSLDPSHVLRAMDVPFNYAHGSIRFSLSRYTTEEEIDHTIAVMPGIIEKLRGLSPFRD